MKPNKVLYFTAGSEPTANEQLDLQTLELLTIPQVELKVVNAADDGLYGENPIDADFYLSQNGTTKGDGYGDKSVFTVAAKAGDLGDLQLTDTEAIVEDEGADIVEDQLGTGAAVTYSVAGSVLTGVALSGDYILVKLGTALEAEDGSKVTVTLTGDSGNEVVLNYVGAP